MLKRRNGVSLDTLMKKFSWQRHTVHGFISILGRHGVKVKSRRNDKGALIYSIGAR